MTNKELIEILSQYPKDAVVFFRDNCNENYEASAQDIHFCDKDNEIYF